MKSRHVHATFIVSCWLLPLALIAASATGTEKTLIVVVALPLTCVWAVAAAMICADRCGKGWPFVRSLLAFVFGLAMIISVAVTHWPLKLAYSLSRPAMDRLAERVQAGEKIAVPVYAGTFKVRQAEVSRHGIVCLWTNLDPAGYTGFVECEPSHVPFNLWSMVLLDDRWQFISED